MSAPIAPVPCAGRWVDRVVLGLIAIVHGWIALKTLALPADGDEPRYLLIAHSLVHDLDINLANNVLNRDYLPFISSLGFEVMRPFGKTDTAYALHFVGLPFLLSPGYAMAGRFGATVILLAVGLVGSATMIRLARRVDSSGLWAPLAVLAIALSFPVAFYSSQAFPDGPAATLIALGLLAVTRPAGPPGPRLALALGLLLAFLPWLHGKFLVPLAMIYLAAAVGWGRSARGRLAVAALVMPIGPSLIVAALAYWNWYGNPLPTGPMGGGNIASVERMLNGWPGLLIDRDYGLLVRAPIYLVALAALPSAIARRIPGTGLALVLFVAMLAVGSTNFDWWGGSSIPPRYLVPVLPILVLPMTHALQTGGLPARIAAAALAVVGVAMLFSAARYPTLDLARATGTGENRLLEHYQRSWLNPLLPVHVELNNLLPSFVSGPIVHRRDGNITGETGATQEIGAQKNAQVGVPGRDAAGYLVRGSFTWRYRGPAVLTVSMLADDALPDAPVARLEVWQHGANGDRLLAARDVLGRDLQPGAFSRVSLRVQAPNGRDPLEARVFWYGAHRCAVDEVLVITG